MTKYKTARADFEWCEGLCELTDQSELDSQREELMRKPTKALAGEMYCYGVVLWLSNHGDNFVDKENVKHIVMLRRRYADYL